MGNSSCDQLLIIVSLGAMRLNTWTQFILGAGIALVVVTIMTVVLPRLWALTPPVQYEKSMTQSFL